MLLNFPFLFQNHLIWLLLQEESQNNIFLHLFFCAYKLVVESLYHPYILKKIKFV